MHDGAQEREHLSRACFGAHPRGHAAAPIVLLVREKDLAGNFAAHSLIARVAHDADNFDIGFCTWVGALSDVTAERAAIAEVVACKLLVDDRNFRCTGVAVREIAPGVHGKAESGEEAW